jgi:LacI family transcriptional regulator
MPKKKTEGSITIKDIAAICGVSISTVSNVLNGRTNKVSKEVTDKILAAMEETGYKPNYLAKNLRANSTKTIGVIVEDLVIFTTSPIVEGLMHRTEEAGYNVVIENMRLFGRWSDQWMHDDALYRPVLTTVMNKMESMNVDGIVYIAGYEHEVVLSDVPEGVPIAVVYASSSDPKIPCFKLDDEQGGYMSYKYLHSMGHSKIAIISGEASNLHTVNRLRGIQRAMFEDGVLFDPSYVVPQSWNKAGGYNGMQQLSGKGFTAVICFSDLIASGVYEYLLEHDMKPGKDLSIIGYDNHEVSMLLSPTLTTIALSLENMGEAAVSWIIKICEGEDADRTDNLEVRIPGELVERNSVVKLA